MFDKLKQAVRHRAEEADEMRAHPGPVELRALPPGTARAGGLAAIPLDVAGRYVGLEIAEIRPLDRLGPETSSLIADKLRQRLREAVVGEPGLEPGELVAGQNAARVARMRAQGMSEEQIAMIQQRISDVTAEHRGQGWTIELTNGNRASVVFAALDDEHGGFAPGSRARTSRSTRVPARTTCSGTSPSCGCTASTMRRTRRTDFRERCRHGDQHTTSTSLPPTSARWTSNVPLPLSPAWPFMHSTAEATDRRAIR